MIMIGNQYVARTNAKNPWNDCFYTVTEVRGNWVRLRATSGYYIEHTKLDLWLFYKKIG